MRSMTHIGIAALVAAVGLVAGRSATAADDSAYDDWVQSVIRHCEGAQAPPDEVASCIQRAKREREHAVTPTTRRLSDSARGLVLATRRGSRSA